MDPLYDKDFKKAREKNEKDCCDGKNFPEYASTEKPPPDYSDGGGMNQILSVLSDYCRN